MEKFDVIDVWREKSPDDKSFTWSNRMGTRQSRVDFWLVSNSIDKNNITANILTMPLTDHRAVYINVQLFASHLTHCRSSYWKLNNSLLEHKSVKKEINKLVSQFWDKAKKEKSYSTNWELFKFEVCKFLRRYGSYVAKSRRIEEEEIISKIALFYQRSPEDIPQEDRLNLLDLRSKLDDIYQRKAEGAFVRSRKRWLEEGEQNSAYFFKLEKHRSKINSIHQLNINGAASEDAKLISNSAVTSMEIYIVQNTVKQLQLHI